MIVSLAGQKGGSGKTTTAICLADEWHRQGYNTLLVDTDPQATAQTWGDVATEKEIDGPTVIGMGDGFHETLPDISSNYDRTVIDCPPGNSQRQRSAFMVSDGVLIPSGPGITDIWSMAETIDIAKKAQSIRKRLNVWIFITRKDSRTVISEKAEAALDDTSIPRLESTLGSRVAFQETPAEGVGVTRYKPNGTAASEVKSLVNELEQNMEVQNGRETERLSA